MNQKITQLEIEKWSKYYLDYFNGWMSTSLDYKNASTPEQEKCRKQASLVYSQIKLGNTLTILFFVDNLLNTFKLLPDNIRNFRHLEIDNLTNEEWLTNIKKRVKEHHIARGYYNPNNPFSLSTFKQKYKNANPEQNKSDKLLAQMNDEDLSFVWNFLNFSLLLKEIDPTIDFSKERDISEEEWQAIGFLFEDLIKTIEVTQEKLRQKSNTSSQTNTPSSSQNLTNEEKQKMVKKMADDKQRLKTQGEKLRSQTPINNLDQSLRNQLLADNAREIAERDKEIARLLKNTSSPNQNQESNNSKLNWAIGLGIVAVLIGLIGLIWFANRRKER